MRMQLAGIDRSLVEEISHQTQFTFRHLFVVKQSNDSNEEYKDFWIPLPFHNMYSKALKSASYQFTTKGDIQDICTRPLGKRIRFGVAWKLANSPLVSIVRKY